jgi:hypothetical protein
MRFSAKHVSPYILLGLLVWVGLLIAVRVMISNGLGGSSNRVNQTIDPTAAPLVLRVSDRVLGRSTEYIGPNTLGLPRATLPLSLPI